MGWRTGEREGDVPTQPSGSGEDIPEFYLIIIIVCVVVACFVCVASAGG